MTDEELIARLRKYKDDLLSITADRIEALVKERDDLEATAIKAATVAQEQRARAERLEAALRPFADIGIGTDPDYQPIIRMDRAAIIAARTAIADVDCKT